MREHVEKYSLYRDFIKGVWRESPTFRLILGMCPTLAVTNRVENGLAMGLATTFVLVSSSFVVSLIRKIVPNQVRIATFVVIIATFVTVADLFLAGNFPTVSKALGPYVPLIVVNCIILGRAEAFASKHRFHRASADALGMGVGFILALTILSSIREIFGEGKLLGFTIIGKWFEPWVIMILPPGAFLTLGILIGVINFLSGRGAATAHGHH